VGVGPTLGLPVRIGERRLVIPSWAVTGVKHLRDAGQAKGGRFFMLGEGLVRQEAGAVALDRPGWLVEVSAGIESATFLVDDVYEMQEGFIKQLSEAFNGQGRFSGVVVIEARDDSKLPAAREELCLVLNPAYLVYGGLEGAAETPVAGKVATIAPAPVARESERNSAG
jgi:hypothetical protein